MICIRNCKRSFSILLTQKEGQMFDIRNLIKRNKKIRKCARRIREYFLKYKIFKIITLKAYWNTARRLSYKDDYSFAKYSYKYVTGKELDLINPMTFDEKLWWLKLNNRDPLTTKCTDKYLVRDYVREVGLDHILIPLYGVYNNFEEIDFSKLPERCFIKCNHTSGCNAAYFKNLFFDYDYFRRRFSYVLKHNHYTLSREWNYKNIKPKIIVEENISKQDDISLPDYRFLCFKGEPKLLMIDINTCKKDGTIGNARRNLYDMDFNLINFTFSKPHFSPNLINKPINFYKMIEYAKILCKEFPFCRIDLYNVNGQIYFGEITFYHAGGYNNIEPIEWDLRLGNWIDIRKINGINYG